MSQAGFDPPKQNAAQLLKPSRHSTSKPLWLDYIIYDFLRGNNYPDSPHLQGGMKFAMPISPLLNFM